MPSEPMWGIKHEPHVGIHAVRGNTGVAACGKSVGPMWATMRGIVTAHWFAEQKDACPACVRVIGPVSAPTLPDVHWRELDASDPPWAGIMAAVAAGGSESDHTVTVKRDGNLFCALCGPNLQEGIAGFGPTISDALHALADVWYTREPAPPEAAGGFAGAIRRMHEDREALGRIVRAIWIAWAKEQPNPKPSWLLPWEELSEPEREIDRRIGATIADFAERGLRQQLAEVSQAIGTTEFMDPPDGGDVSLAEQVRKMRQQLAAAREDVDALLEAVGRAVLPDLNRAGRKCYPGVKTAIAEIERLATVRKAAPGMCALCGWPDYDHRSRCPNGGTAPELIEAISAKVHDGWMDTKRAQGVTSRTSEAGEELMVPYDLLSEAAKDLDRGSVRAVLAGLEAAGYGVALRARTTGRTGGEGDEQCA